MSLDETSLDETSVLRFRQIVIRQKVIRGIDVRRTDVEPNNRPKGENSPNLVTLLLIEPFFSNEYFRVFERAIFGKRLVVSMSSAFTTDHSFQCVRM
jgi:hypothetical protein